MEMSNSTMEIAVLRFLCRSQVRIKEERLTEAVQIPRSRGGARNFYLGGLSPSIHKSSIGIVDVFPEGFAPLRILRRSYEYKASIHIGRQISYFYS